MKVLAAAAIRAGFSLAALSCLSLTACGPMAATAGAMSQAASTRPAAASPPFADRAQAAKAEPKQSGGAAVKRADLLDGVSCTGRVCAAAGYFYYGSSAEHVLIDSWNGSAWQLESSANPPQAGALNAVSCASSVSCTAVGSPLLTWNGVGWRMAARPPSPFSTISCVAGGFCAAAGESINSWPVFGAWNGGRWVTIPLHAPPHPAQSVTAAGVSCSSAEFCLAVGDYSYGEGAMPSPSYRDRTLAEEWTGTAWTVLRTANAGPRDQLTAVSCTSPDACTAVGAIARQYPLAEQWDGTSWQVERMPAPAGTGYTALSAVSCDTARACMAVGDYQGLPIAYSWNGAGWQLHWLPRPQGDNNSADLNAVSCASRLSCMAVGDSGNELSYAERWNGATWRLVSTPNPAGGS